MIRSTNLILMIVIKLFYVSKICEHFPDESEIKEHLEEVNNVYQNKIEYENLTTCKIII